MPAFDYHGPFCSMAAFKEHAVFGFWRGELIVPGAKSMAAMGQFGRLTSLADLPPDEELLAMIRKGAALNEAGVKGPPRPKREKRPIAMPPDLAAALKKNAKARATFEGLSPSHRREYLEWITEAKTEATRKRRLATTLEWLAEGKPLNWKYMPKPKAATAKARRTRQGAGQAAGAALHSVSRMVAVAALALALASGSPAEPPDSRQNLEAELRRMTQELLDAVAPGRTEPWARYLDERFVHMDETGVVRTKAELLAEFQPLPPGLSGRIEIDKFQVTRAGETAVVALELQEYLDYHGQPIRSRFRSLDTWIATDRGWRLIGQHTSAVLKDPPAVRLTRQELCEYAGVYSLTPAIQTTIRCVEGGLTSERADRPLARYSPELRDLFFVPGQPRTRRIFTRDAAGRIDGFVDRREGEDVRWRRVAGAPQ